MKKFLAFALAAFAAATPALSADELHFTRDGNDYVATVAEKDGYQLITGKNLTTGEPFRLRVANGRVNGDFAGRQVSFAGKLAEGSNLAAAD